MNRTIRRLSVGIVSVTLALTVGAGVTAAQAAEPNSSSSSDCSYGQHLLYIAKRIPAELRAEAREVRAMTPGPERAAAAKELRARTLAGDFGAVAQKRALAIDELTPEQLRDLPARLKADLRDLRDAPRGDKLALLEQISENALDGVYGDAAQARVEKVRDSDEWQNCTVPVRTR